MSQGDRLAVCVGVLDGGNGNSWAVFQLEAEKVSVLVLLSVAPDSDTAGSLPPMVTVTVFVGWESSFTVY